MQIQLIIADGNRKGQVIPVNVPSFMIGRAEGCNLRSRSPNVSRHHCTLLTNNGMVTVQDLGSESGTFVNGDKVSSQELKDGDRLVVGTHMFVMSLQAGMASTEPHQGETFELATSIIAPPNQEQSDTRPVDSQKAQVVQSAAKPPKKEAEVMFEIRLDGQRMSVTKSRLFELARKGSVLPDDLVTVAGTKVFADSIQGIVFGELVAPSSHSPTGSAVLTGSAVPTGSAGLTGSAVQPTPSAAPLAKAAPPETDPFAFSDFGGHSGASPFDHLASEPVARVARKESAFGALWKALDISFSRVYTIEGNNLVIHSIKALYYVLVVGAFILFFKTVVDFGIACSKEESIFLEELGKHYMGVAVTLFGGVTIIVIVRVLLEMLLLAWIESASTQEPQEKDE